MASSAPHTGEAARRAALAKVDNSDSYKLAPDEAAFLKAQTGITDDAQLRAHVEDIQRRAYVVYPYGCIHRFAFTKLKIARHFAYPRLLALPTSRSRAIFLDIGCCFGNDIRKAIADGYPSRDAVASDLRREFWNIGNELFSSLPPPAFVQADAFTLKIDSPSQSSSEPPADLSELKSLEPLCGHVSAIHASALFHLFDFEQQERLARVLAHLLSTTPGSMVFGIHSGQPIKRAVKRPVSDAGMQYCHGPDSWKTLWESIFGEGKVEVESALVERADIGRAYGAGENGDEQTYHIIWCVTGL